MTTNQTKRAGVGFRRIATNWVANGAVLLLILQISFVSDGSCAHAVEVAEDNYTLTRSVEYERYPATESKPAKKMLADLYLPKGEGTFPTILMVHGGAWFSGNKTHVTLHARDVASAGYAVVAINYRLAPTYKFPAQVDDCRTALRWIKKNASKYGFDTERVAAYGYSAGAHLACLLGMTQAESETNAGVPRVRAVVAGGTPCEFSWIPAQSERLAFWLGGSPTQVPDRYKAASPTSFVDTKDPPTFLFHGMGDNVVPLSSAEKMDELLRKQGVKSTLHAIKDASHLGAFIDADARRLAIEFLDKELKTAKESAPNAKQQAAATNSTE